MGWSFRKSLRLGPLRINFSKSGVGYSVGGKGVRVGKSAKGRRYTSASIPGTGIAYRSSKSDSASKVPAAKGSPTFALILFAMGLFVLYQVFFA